MRAPPIRAAAVASTVLLIGVASAPRRPCLGLVFIAPLVLPEYPPALLACGRYIAFGLIALVPAWFDRHRMRRLSRADWREATKLGLVGNLLYHTCLASAIQLAGAPLPTMIIGTLPLVIAVVANLGAERVAWRRLALPMGVLAAGWRWWNHHEMSQFDAAVSLTRYGLGSSPPSARWPAGPGIRCATGPGSRRIRRWRPAVGPPPRGAGEPAAGAGRLSDLGPARVPGLKVSTGRSAHVRLSSSP